MPRQKVRAKEINKKSWLWYPYAPMDMVLFLHNGSYQVDRLNTRGGTLVFVLLWALVMIFIYLGSVVWINEGILTHHWLVSIVLLSGALWWYLRPAGRQLLRISRAAVTFNREVGKDTTPLVTVRGFKAIEVEVAHSLWRKRWMVRIEMHWYSGSVKTVLSNHTGDARRVAVLQASANELADSLNAILEHRRKSRSGLPSDLRYPKF